jgi:hypothetical protein
MRRTVLFAALVAGFSLGVSAARANAQMHPAGHTTPAFDQLKSLAGEWDGKDTAGKLVSVKYKVISNGSVLMEWLQPVNEPEMVTMYSLDGVHIVAQHYCSAGNQPVMQTPAADAATGKYEFSFVRVSGTTAPDEKHMMGLSVSMPDKDHLIQVWTFGDQGKTASHTLTFTRKS